MATITFLGENSIQAGSSKKEDQVLFLSSYLTNSAAAVRAEGVL